MGQKNFFFYFSVKTCYFWRNLPFNFSDHFHDILALFRPLFRRKSDDFLALFVKKCQNVVEMVRKIEGQITPKVACFDRKVKKKKFFAPFLPPFSKYRFLGCFRWVKRGQNSSLFLKKSGLKSHGKAPEMPTKGGQILSKVLKEV